ncbi:hypothetical protein MDA_GLEAN10021919 [Myotis davidii]|uniref:Uncharacterized protein n=1 Tax=Myotis davidii TaxID=225400 RepID=L5LJ80_MYODS|nr:hypothetical protein MDA_GLEAN10021919 [Myotis davidii]
MDVPSPGTQSDLDPESPSPPLPQQLVRAIADKKAHAKNPKTTIHIINTLEKIENSNQQQKLGKGDKKPTERVLRKLLRQ